MVGGKIGDALLASFMRHEEKRRNQLDEDIAELLFTGDLTNVGRVVRNENVPTRSGYMIPGRLLADGKARLVVNPRQYVDEARQKWPDA